MKTLGSLFIAAFLLLATTSFSQEQKAVFETAGLSQYTDGTPCVQLAWKKGGENTAYYLVERSADGISFKQIALVFTAEDASFTNYQYRDKGFASAGAAAWYRIAVVNATKELTYLPVKKVDVTSSPVSTPAKNRETLSGRK